ncbi:MAG: hypothetical protein R6U29_10335 [Desulfosudaceae bacterium]
MNFFDHSLLMHKLKLVIDNFRFFFKIQIVTGCLKIFHHLSIEKIHPSGESPWAQLLCYRPLAVDLLQLRALRLAFAPKSTREISGLTRTFHRFFLINPVEFTGLGEDESLSGKVYPG